MMKYPFFYEKLFEIRIHFFITKLEGLKIGGLQITVYIYGLMADEPGRSEVCSHKQHNGLFGCIYCLNPGIQAGILLLI